MKDKTPSENVSMAETGRRLAASGELSSLQEIMKILLSPEGCPWDRKQTHASLVKCLREESEEVAAAVGKEDWENLKEELGDVLLQVAFQAELASAEGKFGMEDVIRGINAKLVRRHPHVFGGGALGTPEEVVKQWEAIKKEEKKGKN